MERIKQSAGLNDIQIGLLRMFDRGIPDDEVLKIKKVLVNHLSERLLTEVDSISELKGITDDDFLKLESDDLRTKSKKTDD